MIGFINQGHSQNIIRAMARAIGLFIVSVIMVLISAHGQNALANSKYASIVMDSNTGKVLYARNADKQLHPASLTKVMTLLLTFEAIHDGKISRRDRIYVSKRAASMVPSKLGLRKGETIRVEDAIYALVTKSANDVAVALAEHIAGSEWKFSRLMTNKAKEIGMHRTQFQNASGLHNRYQVSTARDMAVLARYMIINHPRDYRYFSTASFRYKGRSYHNHNRLMSWYKGMDGLKTGYINASGFNLVASAVRKDTRLIGVVFGGKTTRSRDKHMARILDGAFARTNSTRLASAVLPVPDKKPNQGTNIAAPSQSLVASLTQRILNKSNNDNNASQEILAQRNTQQANNISASIRSAHIIPAHIIPAPAKKPHNIDFQQSSSFKLARFKNDDKTNENLAKLNQEEFIPAAHFEMLARVLGSTTFEKIIGQGDYDPSMLSRIETGLIALSAHTGQNKMPFGGQGLRADELDFAGVPLKKPNLNIADKDKDNNNDDVTTSIANITPANGPINNAENQSRNIDQDQPVSLLNMGQRIFTHLFQAKPTPAQ